MAEIGRRENWANGRLWLYNGLIMLLSPLILLQKWKRYRKKKYLYEIDMRRWNLRLPPHLQLPEKARNDESLNSRPRVVFVGSGIGEMRTIECLSALLQRARPDCEIVWAIRDRESCEIARREYPNQLLVTVPFEFIWPLWRWLHGLRPNVVAIVEKLWTPNLVWCSRCSGARVLTLNSNFRNYNAAKNKEKIWKLFNAWTLAGFDVLCFQREQDRQMIAPLLSPHADVRVAGIVKFESSTRTSTNSDLDNLKSWLQNARELPILVAGSTHPGEEEFVLQAFDEVRQQTPCVLLIAPRRAERATEVGNVVRAHKFQPVFRIPITPNSDDAQQMSRMQSSGVETASKGEVLILNSMGELSDAYRFGVASFVGGTLYGIGHNVVEPLVYGISVAYGPGNGKENPSKYMRDICREAGVGFEVKTPHELAAHWLEMTTQDAARKMLREKIGRLLHDNAGAAQRNVDAIIEMMPSESQN